MLSRETLGRLLFPNSLESIPTDEANGSGWSVTYDCLLFSANLHNLFSDCVATTNGFLIRIRLSKLVKPLYIQPSSSYFFIGSSSQLLHFPPSHFSSYSSTLNFVLSTLSKLGVPASDPNPLSRLIFSFANRHYLSATTSLVPLHISFTSTTVLRNQAEAADWVNGGAPESQVVKTLRMTFESLRKLKRESLNWSCLMKSCGEDEKCMVCLEGFEEETKTKRSVCKLSCSHMFHFRCVFEWFSLDHRCPICRSPMPWVHALFPDIDINAADTASSSSSHNSTATSYFDHDDDDDDNDDEGHKHVDSSYNSSDTNEPSGILTRLG